MNKDNLINVPAFPLYERGAGGQPLDITDSGMTLRDYFAAKAMQGYLANGLDITDVLLASYAYDTADAMLKARLKKVQP